MGLMPPWESTRSKFASQGKPFAVIAHDLNRRISFPVVSLSSVPPKQFPQVLGDRETNKFRCKVVAGTAR